ncbi:4Fe-4S binding protein [Ignicoccus hospitalis]|uniref:4Fe-4S ferredoxin, iron-sulfur binding domain protein n=1 Tax=Ignicoccus hospitalis (strain KIN4/I / DSM 18386 / JCM 14125) TaxID=453591 RepID=A8A8V5_IGNH4|nr:4Fe-4S binding protein [Ignicoccus hospitalis]ABU81357.1 4Fe-4S ferredoxin, iron-sulfur binding domain protein [Ignicoccus hospitalis KIN4/I]HIH90339.1 4Fe-4S binding protein [Desulfurococcaceae archaeon]
MVRVAVVGLGGEGKTLLSLKLAELLGAVPVEAKEVCELHYFIRAPRVLIKTVESFYPAVVKDKCLRCNLCAAACPDKAMLRDEEGYPSSVPDLCSSCTSCFWACPHGALERRSKVVAKIYKVGKALQLEGKFLKGLLKDLDSLAGSSWVLDAERPEYALFADAALVVSRDPKRRARALQLANFLEKNGTRAVVVNPEEQGAEEVLDFLNHL